MNVLRQNTDYALRVMSNLAGKYDRDPVSSRVLARQENVSYQFACKILQRLHKAGLVASCMGPAGGFRLSKSPSKINLLQVVEAVQGPLRLNNCLPGPDMCPRRPTCPVSSKLVELQKYIERRLRTITLDTLLTRRKVRAKHTRKVFRGNNNERRKK